MAEVLGVGLDRVKSITSGRVAKFTPEESRALVEKLHVRGDYLATGTGPIFRTMGEEQLDSRMVLLREATDTVLKMSIDRRHQELVRDIIYGVALKDADLVSTTITSFVAESPAPPPAPVRKKRSKS